MCFYSLGAGEEFFFYAVTVLGAGENFLIQAVTVSALGRIFCFDLQFFARAVLSCLRLFVLIKDTHVAALCVSTSQPIIMGSGKECGVEREP